MINQQLFRTTTPEELRHIATVWYETVRPTIMSLNYAIWNNYTELYVVYKLEDAANE